MDHVSEVISRAFHDSEIAKRFSCRRTKSAAIAYNVLGNNFEEKMLAELRPRLENETERSPVFSLIIDESTDVSTTKVLAAAIKYYSEKLQSPQTKFLCMVDLKDFILPITTKFNVIFQSDQTLIHKIDTDIQNMMSSILSCFMKINYIKTTSLQSIDPSSSMHFLPIQNMYLGTNVAITLELLKDDVRMKSKIEEFLNRCQAFLIELSKQFLQRLPVQDNFLQDLSFIDPQKAVYGEFRTLIKILQRFPNLVTTENMQIVDNEYRELKLDVSVSNLLSTSSSTSENFMVDKFWSEVSQICDANSKPKYGNLARFVKQMTILPLSNAKVERIFSDINRIKSQDRNRFNNKNVAAIMHGKEGLRQLEGGCSRFDPDKSMIKLMDSKQLYDNIQHNDEKS
ncbi:unnamed protein product [Pieris macdunnoughi]|uniref:HAT C-terminal dimerisation domain-containing protein n=1 Tax=Pieris macdunnoughi TaxID=345717 RepID=A0A821TU14_9NEOP|nr:unnamed protein product [Pieris macdunnoughi]